MKTKHEPEREATPRRQAKSSTRKAAPDTKSRRCRVGRAASHPKELGAAAARPVRAGTDGIKPNARLDTGRGTAKAKGHKEAQPVALSKGWLRIWSKLTRAQQTAYIAKAKASRMTLAECLNETAAEAATANVMPPRSVSTTISPDLRKRMESAAKGTEIPPADLLRVGLDRVLQEYEATGGIRCGTPPAKVTTPAKGKRSRIRVALNPDAYARLAKSAAAAGETPGEHLKTLALELYLSTAADKTLQEHSPDAPLTVSQEHEKHLRFVADMLEVTANDFLVWMLDDYTKNLLDPKDGLLAQWAMGGMIEYDKAGKARVRKKYLAWEKSLTAGKAINHGRAAQ
jgi:hypothetical protein